METLPKSFLLIFLCLNFALFAQQKPENPQELAEIYSNYFNLNREAVFLHLNKTKVAPQESIWFSAYSYSPQFYLPNITTNLHVNLYNSEGKLMEAKTIFLENGQGEGYFELDSEKYESGEYLIRGGTKYMENFREESFFTQSFTIVGETNTPVVPREYDLQLLPEGGHLVANVENSVGVKLIDNLGKGVAFTEGKILNAQQEVISTFKSNEFGLSKFRFTPEMAENYSVLIELEDGESLQKTIPKPEARGIALITTVLRDQILFTFKTNHETFNSLEYTDFLFTFHKDGAIKALNFVISEMEMGANLTLTKDVLFNGVNTITVFNGKMEAVVERLIFNRDSISRKEISADFQRKEADSLMIKLSSPENLGLHSMSISILPAETISYEPNNNIFSAFYIEPYIEGNLENGGYYFSEDVELRRRDYDLDLLLLTQGWSKYSWQNIFNNSPKEYYKHEHGFTLAGSVLNRNPKRDKKLFISSTSDRLSVITEIAENGTFKVENVFIKDSAQVSFSLIDERNNKMSDPSIVANLLPARENENINPPKFLELDLQEDIEEAAEMARENAIFESFIVGTQMLDTVFIQSQTRTEEEKFLELERELNRGEMFGKFDLLSEEEVRANPTILSLLRMKRFEVRGSNIYSTRELMRKPLGGSFGLPPEPALVLIDGMESDLITIQALRTREIISIYTSVNVTGGRASLNGNGGIIEIVTKNPGYYSNSKTTASTLLKSGFAAPQQFYVPKYNSYSNELFRNYGAIGWFPEITLKNGNLDLKIFNTLQPAVKLFIEGMTAEGALISEEILVEIN